MPHAKKRRLAGNAEGNEAQQIKDLGQPDQDEATEIDDELIELADAFAQNKVEDNEAAANSSLSFKRVAFALRSKRKISKQEHEADLQAPLFDDKRLQEKKSTGAAWNRFEHSVRIKRKHRIEGTESLSPASKKVVYDRFTDKENIVPLVSPATPQKDNPGIPHVKTPHGTLLKESSSALIGATRYRVFMEAGKVKRKIGLVHPKAKKALIDVLDNKDEQEVKLEAASLVSCTRKAMAYLSAAKYKKFRNREIPKGRNQNHRMGESAAKHFDRYGFENVIDIDGKPATEWLDIFSRDLLFRASEEIVIDGFECKIVPKNLDLVAKNDSSHICTQLLLFAGSKGCNTHMMIAEYIQDKLLAAGIDIVVYSAVTFYKDSNIAEQVELTIEAVNMKLLPIKFTFNPLRYDAPSSVEARLWDPIIDRYIQKAKEIKENVTIPSLVPRIG